MHRWQGVLLLALVTIGCRLTDAPPDLVRVLDVVPREVEPGDRLEVVGTDFPQGVTGTVTLHGDLYAPGRRPRRGVSVTLRGERTTHDRVGVTLVEALEDEMCGGDEQARRTTFRGEVVVAFSPRRPGAPPLTGRARDIVLVFDPGPPPDQQLTAEDAEAAQLLAFVGLMLEPQEQARALRVRSVLPDSRAERAGLEPGDELLEAAGVRLREARDLLPAPGQRTSRVAFQRGRLPDPIERDLDLDGFRPAPPADLQPIGILLGLVAAVVLTFVTPVGRTVAWVAVRVARRLRASAARRVRGEGYAFWIRELVRRPFVDDLLPHGAAGVLRVVPYVLFLGVSAASTQIAISGRLVTEDLDLLLLWLAAATALFTTGLALGGARGGRAWSLAAGLRTVLALAVLEIPVAASLACAVLAAGSLRPGDLASTQGPLPWQWLAFRDPVMLLAALLLLVPVLPQSARPERELPEAELEPGRPPVRLGFLRGLMFCVEWAHVCVLATLFAMVFLGGNELPLLGIGAQSARPLWQLVAVVLLELKCWGIVLLIVGLRWALPQVSVEQLLAPTVRWVLPPSLAAVALTLALQRGPGSSLLRACHGALGVVTFGTVSFLLFYFVRRVLARVNRPGPHAALNPWL